MKSARISRILLGLAAALVLSSVSSAEILKIVVNDTIQPITEEYIARAIDEAQRRNDQAILIEINTPGGLVESTRHIIEKITNFASSRHRLRRPQRQPRRFRRNLHPGSRPMSQPWLLEPTLARRIPSYLGPLAPKLDDEMKRKIENDTAALMRSVVSRRGRNVEVAESAVRQSKSFTEQEALSQHLIDYVASSEDDLFRQIDSKSVKRFNGQEVTLNSRASPSRLSA